MLGVSGWLLLVMSGCVCMTIPIRAMPRNCKAFLPSTHKQTQENLWECLGLTEGFGECLVNR
jgi:hypothetical protein